MMGYKESFINTSEHESPHKVKLGDDYQYPIKGSGEASYKLDYVKYLKISWSQACMKLLHPFYGVLIIIPKFHLVR